MRRLWFPILLGVLLTAALLCLGIVFSKSDGEWFSILFFPYLSLLSFALPGTSNNFVVALGYAMFFIQYPVYFIVLKLALDRNKFYRWLLTLLGLHMIVAAICFMIFRR